MIDPKGRYFINPFLNGEFIYDIEDLQNKIRLFLADAKIILNNYDLSELMDKSIYSGSIGIIIALSKINCQNIESFYSESLYRNLSKKRRIGFCSDLLSVTLFDCLCHNREFDIESFDFRNEEISDEILYGKCGYALLVDYFSRKGLKLKGTQSALQIIEAINLNKFPWSWHEKVYFGSAHGTSGIINTILHFQGPTSLNLIDELIKLSILPSGNFKSSIASNKDELIQWCHGAPGFISVLFKYLNHLQSVSNNANNSDHQTMLSEKIADLKALITTALDEIWKRGLLTKGAGVCHGISGNAFPFLLAFIFFKDPTYLTRAAYFTYRIIEMGPTECCKKADNPFCLFNGLSGVSLFMMDILKILEDFKKFGGKFPEQYCLFDDLGIF